MDKFTIDMNGKVAFFLKVLTFVLKKKCKDDLNFVVLSAFVLGNYLDPDQAQHNVGSDRDPNCLIQIVFQIYFDFEKCQF